MDTKDNCCSISPYFKIQKGKLAAFKAICAQMVETTKQESQCLYYGFSFDEDLAHCREGYDSAEGLLAHIENIGPLLGEALKLADLTRLEIHGPEDELAKLRAPLADLKPQFFVFENGFRR